MDRADLGDDSLESPNTRTKRVMPVGVIVLERENGGGNAPPVVVEPTHEAPVPG